MIDKATFSIDDTKFGLIVAIFALPFVWAAASLAAESQISVLFSGSKWFTFKASFALLELVVFAIAAAAHRSRAPKQVPATDEQFAHLNAHPAEQPSSGKSLHEQGDA